MRQFSIIPGNSNKICGRDFPQLLSFFVAAIFLNLFCISYAQNTAASPPDYIQTMKKYLATPAAEADKNSLKEFVNAMESFDYKEVMALQPKYKVFFETGWQANDPAIDAILQKNIPVMTMIYNGCKKPFVRYPKWNEIVPDPFTAPVPNFLQMQNLSDIILLQALKNISQNQYDSAIDIFETSLIFGQRLSDENTTTLSKLISIGHQKKTFSQIEKFLSRVKLTEAQYNRLGNILFNYVPNKTSIQIILKNESANMKIVMEKLASDPNVMKTLSADEKAKADFESVMKNKDEYLKIIQTMFDEMIKASSTSYSAIKNFNTDPYVEKLGAAGNLLVPNFTDMIARDYEITAWSRLMIYDVAIRKYFAKNNAYPANFDAIGITGEKGLDPFSGNFFIYKNAGGKPIIYSIGPDAKDDGGTIIYDPKKGIDSPGDIVVGF